MARPSVYVSLLAVVLTAALIWVFWLAGISETVAPPERNVPDELASETSVGVDASIEPQRLEVQTTRVEAVAEPQFDSSEFQAAFESNAAETQRLVIEMLRASSATADGGRADLESARRLLRELATRSVLSPN